jgi:hypothetical protein
VDRFGESIITVTFRPSPRATVVEIHQVGLPDEEARASHHAGWVNVLRQFERATDHKTKAGS